MGPNPRTFFIVMPHQPEACPNYVKITKRRRLRPRTKVFVHFPIEITRLFDKIIGKIIRAYESTLKELSYATKLVTVAQFV